MSVDDLKLREEANALRTQVLCLFELRPFGNPVRSDISRDQMYDRLREILPEDWVHAILEQSSAIQRSERQLAYAAKMTDSGVDDPIRKLPPEAKDPAERLTFSHDPGLKRVFADIRHDLRTILVKDLKSETAGRLTVGIALDIAIELLSRLPEDLIAVIDPLVFIRNCLNELDQGYQHRSLTKKQLGRRRRPRPIEKLFKLRCILAADALIRIGKDKKPYKIVANAGMTAARIIFQDRQEYLFNAVTVKNWHADFRADVKRPTSKKSNLRSGSLDGYSKKLLPEIFDYEQCGSDPEMLSQIAQFMLDGLKIENLEIEY